jgi:predicted ribosomally synthesized peptide with nif11-like leader
MSKVNEFYKAMADDAALRERANAVTANPTAEDIVSFAKKEGYDFTAGELAEYQEAAVGELEDGELENVAGGATVYRGSAIFNKHEGFVRLTVEEEKLLKKHGYNLYTNGWYSSHDYYEITDPTDTKVVGVIRLDSAIGSLGGPPRLRFNQDAMDELMDMLRRKG